MSDGITLSSGLSMTELGARIRGERRARGISLERLAELSGVSRSMVSEVERGAKTPSVLVLDRLATALGTSIARLLDEPVRPDVMVLAADRQHVVRDPAGWERRILSPVLPDIEFEFMRTTLEPGVDAGEFSPHAPGSHEYVAVEHGCLHLTVDGVAYRLAAGDAAYFPGNRRHAFANDSADACVYYLAMTLAPAADSHLHLTSGGHDA
ncbi:helix-turn-helix domain-containing protein [Streptomyces sp. NPDC002917]|uniref:helix-turn-helix domain-containing protein n=1 Tax=unclassified Streptomyces TaxID=2593676 RepID=UPI0033B69061|nr:XRE family transcriptional regulator [Streptomyces sp. NBC_01653]WTD93576.1 XRE family transcriptional regulator [Streptomyces sp. NBC_01637]WTF25633.1 XRE family transcriptional regulator [Streptomyces sp. NBC_01602]